MMQRRFWDYWLGDVDGRPVAFFRIILSLILLKDAIYHLSLTHWFYSDAGIVPRVALFDNLAREHRFSLMDAVSHDWMATLFFLLWIAVLLCLLVGYRTRLVAVLNFVLILSIHERNVYILTGADTAFRVFSFWLMFAASNRYYAVDAYRNPPQSGQIFALPFRMLQLQLVIIYATTAYLKWIGQIWLDGDALFYVLQLESIRLPLGDTLRHAPSWFLSTITYFVIAIETALPFLLLIPWKQPYLRIVGLIGGFVLHVGIGLTLAIPDFSLVMLSAYVLYFEPAWIAWIAWIARRLRLSPSTPAVPEPETYRHPRTYRMLSLALLSSLLLVVWWNAKSVSEYRASAMDTMPAPLVQIMDYSGLWQYWDLFAPTPYLVDGRFVIEGGFENGFKYDLFTGKPLNSPYTVGQFGPSMRWKKFEEVMFRNQHPQILYEWGSYYCLRYNIDRNYVSGTRLATIDITYVYRRSHAPGEEVNPLETEVMWMHWCFDNYAPDDFEG